MFGIAYQLNCLRQVSSDYKTIALYNRRVADFYDEDTIEDYAIELEQEGDYLLLDAGYYSQAAVEEEFGLPRQMMLAYASECFRVGMTYKKAALVLVG